MALFLVDQRMPEITGVELLQHTMNVSSLVIMYADLVGSTNMSMTLPVDKMVTITRAFTHEMTSTVRSMVVMC